MAWITPNTVGLLHRVFRASLPSAAAGAPVYLAGVSTSSGTHDLVFVTTQAGQIIALDAHTGAQIWIKQHTGVNYTTSSPAVDPNLQFVYSYGLDGFVHKHAVGDGTETTTGGWPELATLKPDVEKESPALAFATTSGGDNYLYVSNGGYPGDAGDYQGHITAINPEDGSIWVFVTTGSGIAGYQLAIDGSGNPSLQARWTGPGGSSPIVADGILYYARSGLISALDPTTGSSMWSNNQIGGIHWETPVVASGMLYIADESNTLNAYATQ